jgi:hypothetical protein
MFFRHEFSVKTAANEVHLQTRMENIQDKENKPPAYVPIPAPTIIKHVLLSWVKCQDSSERGASPDQNGKHTRQREQATSIRPNTCINSYHTRSSVMSSVSWQQRTRCCAGTDWSQGHHRTECWNQCMTTIFVWVRLPILCPKPVGRCWRVFGRLATGRSKINWGFVVLITFNQGYLYTTHSTQDWKS